MTQAPTIRLERARPVVDGSALSLDLDMHIAAPAANSTTRELTEAPRDIVDEWGIESFPASDAPSNW